LHASPWNIRITLFNQDRPYNLITLATGVATADLIELIPHASITPVIDFCFSGGYDMNPLVAHLDGPLICGLQYDRSASAVYAVFKTSASGLSSKFIRIANLPAKTVLDPTSTLLFSLTENVMPRVAKLKVDLQDLALLCRIASISNVKMLAIDVHEAASPSDWAAEGLAAGWARAALPALDAIILSSRPPGLPRPLEGSVRRLMNQLRGDFVPKDGDQWLPRFGMYGFA